jgi:hypothetical protein
MADELKMPYNRDMRIEKLKEYFEKVDSSTWQVNFLFLFLKNYKLDYLLVALTI